MNTKLLTVTLKRARTLLQLMEMERSDLESDIQNSNCTSQSFYSRLDRRIARRVRAEKAIRKIIADAETKLDELKSYSLPVNNLREMTTDEVQEIFIRQMRAFARDWARCHNEEGKSVEYCLDGLLHSFAAVGSGATLSLCSFALIPTPYMEDKKHYIRERKNWFPFNDDDMLNCDIMRNLKYRICEGIEK